MAELSSDRSDSGDLAPPGDDQLMASLEDAVQEVFTTMVFQFREATVSEQSDDIASHFLLEGEGGRAERIELELESVVDFSGSIAGTVVLRFSAEGAIDVARNLLMLDEGDVLEVDEINDALGECANMVSGVLKTKALDPVGTFHLGVPHINRPPQYIQGRSCGRLAYILTEGMVSVEIWLDAESAAA